MSRAEYLQSAFNLYDFGMVDGEVLDAMLLNADLSCDEDEDDGEDE